MARLILTIVVTSTIPVIVIVVLVVILVVVVLVIVLNIFIVIYRFERVWDYWIGAQNRSDWLGTQFGLRNWHEEGDRRKMRCNYIGSRVMFHCVRNHILKKSHYVCSSQRSCLDEWGNECILVFYQTKTSSFVNRSQLTSVSCQTIRMTLSSTRLIMTTMVFGDTCLSVYHYHFITCTNFELLMLLCGIHRAIIQHTGR